MYRMPNLCLATLASDRMMYEVVRAMALSKRVRFYLTSFLEAFRAAAVRRERPSSGPKTVTTALRSQ